MTRGRHRAPTSVASRVLRGAMVGAAAAVAIALAWPVGVPPSAVALDEYTVPPVTVTAPYAPVSTLAPDVPSAVPTTTPESGDVSTSATAAVSAGAAPRSTTPTPRSTSPARSSTRPAPAPAPPAPSGGRCATTLDGAAAHVARAGHAISGAVGFVGSILGQAGRAGVSDHPSGHALDFMISSRAQGDAIADYALANRGALAITYVIWRQRINHGGGWVPMEDRGGNTANHFDHVHVSFSRTAPAKALTC